MKKSILLLWVLIGGSVLVCSVLASLFLSKVLYGEQSAAAASADGHFTLRVDLSKQPAIEVKDNRRGITIPLFSTEATEQLLQQGKGVAWVDWHNDGVCSCLISTGNTRRDRIVWLKVSGNPPKAEVTSLEAVDD